MKEHSKPNPLWVMSIGFCGLSDQLFQQRCELVLIIFVVVLVLALFHTEHKSHLFLNSCFILVFNESWLSREVRKRNAANSWQEPQL